MRVAVSGADVVRALRALGFVEIAQRGSHRKLRKEARTVIVPMHDELRSGRCIRFSARQASRKTSCESYFDPLHATVLFHEVGWYDLGVDGHRTAERRSLAYHRAIAERLARDPSILARARERVAGWAASGTVHPRWTAAWSELLARPLAEVCDRLCEPGEAMTAMRQVTPFAGALDPSTRWQLWRSVPR